MSPLLVLVAAATLAQTLGQATSIPRGDCADAGVVCAAKFNDGARDGETIAAALAAIGEARKTLLLRPGVWSIEQSIAIGRNVTLAMAPGAVLDVAPGRMVTLEGGVSAGSAQHVFAGDGSVRFGDGAVERVLPQWWGALGDGVTDDTWAVQRALDCVHESGGGTVYLPTGAYRVRTIAKTVATSRPFNIVGAAGGAPAGGGTRLVKLGDDADPVLALTGATAPTTWRGAIRDLSIVGTASQDGIVMTGLAWFRIDGVNIYGCATGLRSAGSLTFEMRRCNVQGNGTGVLLRKHPTAAVWANAITIEGGVFGGNTAAAIDFGEGSELNVIDCDIENNGSTLDTATGGLIIRDSVGQETGLGIVTIDRSWFESNRGWALRAEFAGALHLNVLNSFLVGNENGNDILVADCARVAVMNCLAPSGSGGTVQLAGRRSLVTNCVVTSLVDDTDLPVHLNVSGDRGGFATDVFVRRGKGLHLTWANGTGANSLQSDTASGRLLINSHAGNPPRLNSGITLTPIAVSKAVPNTLFVDSADGRLKWMDAGGQVTIVQ